MSAALARVPSVLRSRKTLDKVGTMLAVRVASMGVIKQLDINHPQTVVRVRYVFFAVQLVALLVFVYILFRIRAKNDQTSIRTKPSRIVAKAKAIVTKAVTGKDTPDPKADELVETTVHDHDAAQAKAAIKGIVRSAVLMSAVSIYFGWNKMLIAPAISRPVATLRHALFQLHVLDAEAVGSLAREATPEQVAAAERASAKAKANAAKAESVQEKVVMEEVEQVSVETKEVVATEDGDAVLVEEKTTVKLRQRRAVETQ